MSTPKDLVAEYYAAFNRRDLEIYARLFTANCELVAPGIRVTGIDAMRTFDLAWSSAFSEGRIENLRMLESDGVVLAGNWFHGGTHVRPLPTPAGAIPPNGRTFHAPYCATFEFDGERIQRQRIVFDADYVPVALGAARG